MQSINMELKVIPVLQVIIAIILMTFIDKFFPSFTYDMQFSFYVTYALTLIAIVIGFLAVYGFRKHQTTVNPSKPESSSKIVDSGIYQFSRNPMYLAMLLVLIAYAFYLENIITFLTCGVFFWYITKYQIIPEERMLSKLFGVEYTQYQSQVRRWI